MKDTLTTSQIIDRLIQDEYADWTIEGARAIAEFLEEIEEETGEEIEFDRVAIRCDFSEFETAVEACEEYGLEENFADLINPDADEKEEYAIQLLQEHTIVLEHENGIVMQNY